MISVIFRVFESQEPVGDITFLPAWGDDPVYGGCFLDIANNRLIVSKVILSRAPDDSGRFRVMTQFQ